MLHDLADLVFPPRCLVCRTPGDDALCPGCLRNFALIRPPLCVRCGIPLSPSPVAAACGRCQSEAVPFAAARSMALFKGSLRTAIHRLKFQGRKVLGPLLGRMLAGFVRGEPVLADPDVVIPVPLHRVRLRRRGFNHAMLLAEPVAAAVRAPLTERALIRVAATDLQSALGREERRANVRGAFWVPPWGVDMVSGRSVLLIDDVLTSGATVAECARVLRAAGVAVVRVATLARAEEVTATGPDGGSAIG